MTLTRLDAVATTCRIDPGQETRDSSGLHVRGRVFTDRVESADARLDGTNRVTLDLDINPADGTGTLAGTFELDLANRGGTWKGLVAGHFEGGMVVAEGIARGAGTLDHAVLHVEYRQIAQHPGRAPCAEPLAFFSLRGLMLPSP
jgi:hypothetical protein